MDRVLNFRRPQSARHIHQSARRATSSRLSFVSKTFFGLTLIQVIVVSCCQIAIMRIGNFSPVKDAGMGPSRRVGMVIFLFCIIYTCLLCLVAVKTQNFLEIVAFVFQNYLFLVYSWIQVYQLKFKPKSAYMIPAKYIRFKINPYISYLSLANSIFLVLINITFTVLAVRLFREYGWKIYKKVRFNVTLRSAYHAYELVLCLMKMNLLILSMFSICYNQTVLREFKSSPLYIISIAAIPICVIFGLFGYFGIRKENRLLMAVFIFALVAAIAVYLFAIYKTLTGECYNCKEYFRSLVDLPREVILMLIYLSILGLTFAIGLSVATLKSLCNFGKGLDAHFATVNTLDGHHLSIGALPNLTSFFSELNNESVENDIDPETNGDAENDLTSSQQHNQKRRSYKKTSYKRRSSRRRTAVRLSSSSSKSIRLESNTDENVGPSPDCVCEESTVDLDTREATPAPTSATNDRASLVLGQPRRESSSNILTIFYDKSVLKLSNLYFNVKALVSYRHLSCTKIQNDSYSDFNTITILQNNGINADRYNLKSHGSFSSLNLGDIETDVVDDIRVSVKRTSEENAVDGSSSTDSVDDAISNYGYDYSSPDLMMNIIIEEDEEEELQQDQGGHPSVSSHTTFV